MRKQLLTKMLLIAASLFMGTSAWADPTLVYGRAVTADLANGYTAWSASDVAASGTNVWIGNFVYNETYGIYQTASGNRSSVMTFSHTENSLQTFDIVFDNLGNTGNASNYSYLKIGSAIEIQSNQQNQNGAVIINGVSNAISDCNVKNYNRGGDKWTIHVEINTAKKEVTALTLVGTTMNGKSAHYTLSSTTSLGSSPTFNTVTIGFVRAAGNPAAALTSIKIQEEEQAVSMAGYTINYKAGDDLVKTVSSSSAVGSVITSETAIDGAEEGFVGKHYLITAGEAPSMTLVANAASNVLNVPVRAPYTGTLNVTRTIAGVAETPVVTILTETDGKVCSWVYTYPKYVQKDGVYYVADETSSFGESGSFTNGETINKTVTYTNPDYSVVYFGEPNEVTGANTAYSNGNTGYITGGVGYGSDKVIRLGTLPAGEYRLITNVTGSASRYVVVGGCTDTSAFPVAIVTITSTGAKDESFSVDGSTPISISGKDQGGGKFNQSADVDYILVKAKKRPAPLGTNGYATFASAYPLDLTTANLPAGVKAYKASVSGKTVTFTELNQTVPANTGILIEGTGTSVDIPVAASGTAVTGNAFEVNTTGATFSGDGDYYYFGLVKNTLKFGVFDPSITAIPASKAYLKVLKTSVDAGARELNVVFEDEATGISAIPMNSEVMNNNYFDLQGRRVAQPTKGMYIVNGKKIIIK